MLIGQFLLAGAAFLEFDLLELAGEHLAVIVAQCGHEIDHGAHHRHRMMSALDAFGADYLLSVDIDRDGALAPLIVPVLHVEHRDVTNKPRADGSFDHLEIAQIASPCSVANFVKLRERMLLIDAAGGQH